MNTVIFAHWGLRFLQVATPNDVIISGLSMIVSLAALCIAAWLASSTRQTLVPIKTAIHHIAEFVLGVGGGMAIVVLSSEKNPSVFGLLIVIFFSVRTLSIDWNTVWPIISAKDPTEEPLDTRDQAFGLVLILAIMLFLSSFLKTMTEGQFDGKFFIKSDDLPKGCLGQVLWTGERAIIIRCGTETSQAAIIMSPENIVLEERPLPPQT